MKLIIRIIQISAVLLILAGCPKVVKFVLVNNLEIPVEVLANDRIVTIEPSSGEYLGDLLQPNTLEGRITITYESAPTCSYIYEFKFPLEVKRYLSHFPKHVVLQLENNGRLYLVHANNKKPSIIDPNIQEGIFPLKPTGKCTEVDR